MTYRERIQAVTGETGDAAKGIESLMRLETEHSNSGCLDNLGVVFDILAQECASDWHHLVETDPKTAAFLVAS